MPNFCAVFGCGKRGNRDNNSFFRIPCIPKKAGTTITELKTKRRRKWILALRRADLTETKLKYAVICDRHFISGRPAKTPDIDHPDWIPSINMGYPTKEPSKPRSDPYVEYLRNAVVNENDSSENPLCSQLSSSNSEAQESAVDEDSTSLSEVIDESHYVNFQDTCVDSMREKVQRFLNNSEDFERGLPLNDEEISSIIERLGKDVNIFAKNPEYKDFLKEYGSIYGSGFDICGPICDPYPEYKVEYMTAIHNDFDNSYVRHGMKEERLKHCWLVARDETKYYYIDMSHHGRGYIYSLNFDGRSESFAENFLVLLDRLFEADQEKDSD